MNISKVLSAVILNLKLTICGQYWNYKQVNVKTFEHSCDIK